MFLRNVVTRLPYYIKKHLLSCNLHIPRGRKLKFLKDLQFKTKLLVYLCRLKYNLHTLTY
jgi:hypothetical protein